MNTEMYVKIWYDINVWPYLMIHIKCSSYWPYPVLKGHRFLFSQMSLQPTIRPPGTTSTKLSSHFLSNGTQGKYFFHVLQITHQPEQTWHSFISRCTRRKHLFPLKAASWNKKEWYESSFILYSFLNAMFTCFQYLRFWLSGFISLKVSNSFTIAKVHRCLISRQKPNRTGFAAAIKRYELL